MASLNKLAIRGIRSFDDKHVQVIEFYSPLTVIVGHNGSGKTTIIECLKYATTGDLPPNTKGGAFVHDPKMANEKEVKAQVRLRFWNVNRQRMTATRNLQVTVKKAGGLTMKTLEGILAKAEIDGGDGKRNVISTKCTEMDEEVPMLLGVSKAILENVIFCHQEEANWPLSEPAALKKKFDDIFEATKYTKALDNIKLLRKERTQELKVDKERLQHYKADKDKAERMRKEIDEAIQKETSKSNEAAALKAHFEELKDANVVYYAEATGFQRTFERYESLKKHKSILEANREEQLDGMEVMDDSTEELEHKVKNFEAHLGNLNTKREKQEAQRKKEDEGLTELRRRERNLASTQGGLTANRKAYERNLREREAAVREVAKTHNFGGYDYSPLPDSKIAEFVDKVHELVRGAESDLKKLQADGSRKERDMQSELDRLAGIKSGATATKRSKQDQVSKLNEKIRTAESQFDSVSSFEAEIQLLESKLVENAQSQARLEADIRDAKYDDQIRDKIASIRQKEGEKDKIQGELSILNRQADSRAQLTIKRNEMQGRQRQIMSSKVSHASRFKELVGADLVPETMEDMITAAAGKKERELGDTEAVASASNRTLSQLQTSLNYSKQSLASKKAELKRLENAISEALADVDTNTVEETLEDCASTLEENQTVIRGISVLRTWWERTLQVARVEHKCRGCARAVPSSEAQMVEAHMQDRIVEVRSDKYRQETLQLIADWQERLDKFRKLQPTEATIAELRRSTIPDLERKVSVDSKELDRVTEEVEEVKSKVAKAKVAARDLQTLKSEAAMVSRTLGEIKDLQSDIKRLERDLESSGTLKTVEEVQREVDQLSNEIKNIQREQANLSGEKDLKDNNLRKHQDDHTKSTLRLGQLKSRQERRQREEAALKELQENLVALQAELKDLDVAVQAAEAPWREKNDALIRHRTERANAESEASLQVGIYQSSLGDIEGKHRACQAYVAEGNDRKIRENESQIEDLKREMTAATEARAAVETNLQATLAELAKSESLRSNIIQNIRYRKGEKEIAKVQEQVDEIDIESAAKARKEFNTRYSKNLQEETHQQNAWQLASGQVMQMKENRKKLESYLKNDYSNTDKLFKEQLIKTKISEFANNDLEKYGKALDNAILKYHSIKMDEINDTIGHLWNKTYQGTDIDGIRIVSDSDEVASTTTRKSYNYRVVMVKNDVELDMRGRCSAGQKVLASIIIRLALAESFGQGCGVLALDEPTTNLDQENINALAEALAEIIRERRRQNNFQLIVITHDEGFLQRLAGHDVLEYYWRVSRDASQKSVLERQRIGL